MVMRKRLSLQQRKVFRAPDREPPKDTRKDEHGRGKQGATTCPVCGCAATLKKADSGDINPDAGVARDDLVVSSHRVGGGRVSMMRGDVPCRGSRLPTGV